MKSIKLAVVGATGVVGQMMIKVLEEKELPISKCSFFASAKSKGKLLNFMGEKVEVEELTENSFNTGFDFALFSAGASTSKKFSPIAAEKGCIVIDNSSAFRMDPNVPLIVPEVNSEDISNNHGIIANPNCSTIQAVIALKPLDSAYKIKRIVYSTYQAVSGAGIKGIHDLQNGIENYYHSDKTYDLQKFKYPIFNNCIPHIDDFLDNGYTKEEEKIINETRKILKRPDLAVTATTVRVPVFNSHGESINVEFENDFSLDELKSILKNADGIILKDDPQNNIYPLQTQSNGQDKVLVGRIRRDYSVPYGINLWITADNVRKGAASNAVQILEKLI